MRASLPATVTGALAVARDSCTLSARHSAPPRFSLIAAMASSGFANVASGTDKVVATG
jgi:hypothetical protein